MPFPSRIGKVRCIFLCCASATAGSGATATRHDRHAFALGFAQLLGISDHLQTGGRGRIVKDDEDRLAKKALQARGVLFRQTTDGEIRRPLTESQGLDAGCRDRLFRVMRDAPSPFLAFSRTVFTCRNALR